MRKCSSAILLQSAQHRNRERDRERKNEGEIDKYVFGRGMCFSGFVCARSILCMCAKSSTDQEIRRSRT